MADKPQPMRYIGLDAHKHYLVAIGVDAERKQVYGPQRVSLDQVGRWIQKQLKPTDAIVIEMSANTWQLYDELVEHVHSVTVVHPPYVSLITRAQVMTDNIAALTLAKLHAAGLLPGIWVPSPLERDARALVAQRHKILRMRTVAKNRLQSSLQRHHWTPPEGSLYAPEQRAWWAARDVSSYEKLRIESDLHTLDFAREEMQLLEKALADVAAKDERITYLIQLPGFGILTAVTLLVAIGPIERFPSASHLVGYAGIGVRVHDSGMSHRTGRITKAGRKDIRSALVEAAHTAVRSHPRWKAEMARLEPRVGAKKALVAIARKLLVVVWHVLTERCADRYADPKQVARKFMEYSYHIGLANRQDKTATAFTREQLERLGLGQELEEVEWAGGKRKIPLPPPALSNSPAAK